VKHLADKIGPQALAQGRKNLTRLPVYLAARALDDGPSAVRAHGFAAIGQPGVAGAKIFTHFVSDVHTKVVINENTLSTLKNYTHESAFKSGDKSLMQRAFLPEKRFQRLQAMFDKLSKNGKLKFDSVPEFERACFMHLTEEFLNSLGDPELGIDPHAAEDAKQQQMKVTLGKLTDAQARKFNREVASAAKYQVQELSEHRDLLPGLFTDGELRQQIPSGRHPAAGVNAAELDARLFEDPEQGDRLALNRQDVSATDLIEANRLQMLRNSFLDEKNNQITDEVHAPQLNLSDRVKTADGAVKLFDDMVASKPKDYETVDGTGKKMPVADIKRTRRYQLIHVFSRLKRWVTRGLRKLAGAITGKHVPSANIATPGNCNSAAGSLIRLAGELRGQKVKVKAGAFQHGVKVDTYWNPVDPKDARRPASGVERKPAPPTDFPWEHMHPRF
jgi:hypothetical protein